MQKWGLKIEMTIGGVLLGIFLTVLFVAVVVFAGMGISSTYTSAGKAGCIVAIVLGILLTVATWVGLAWYYNNTASGQRAMNNTKE